MAGIQKHHQCKVSCSGTQYISYSCKAVTHSESDQAQRCLPSLTRVNTHARSTPLYHYTTTTTILYHYTPLYNIKKIKISFKSLLITVDSKLQSTDGIFYLQSFLRLLEASNLRYNAISSSLYLKSESKFKWFLMVFDL